MDGELAALGRLDGEVGEELAVDELDPLGEAGVAVLPGEGRVVAVEVEVDGDGEGLGDLQLVLDDGVAPLRALEGVQHEAQVVGLRAVRLVAQADVGRRVLEGGDAVTTCWKKRRLKDARKKPQPFTFAYSVS